MNIVSTIAAAVIAIGAVATTAEAEHVQRALIIGGEEVLAGSKLYMVGVRQSADGFTFCNGALIAPNLVLTAGYCMRYGPEYVSVGSHYNTGTNDGEQIKVKSVRLRIESMNSQDTNYDFAALILEKPSKYPYITLPAVNATVKSGTSTKAMGWGFTSYPNGDSSNVLLSVGLEVRSNDECGLPSHSSGAADLCAGGVPGKDLCYGDIGAPLIVEGGDGDSDDVLFGLSNGGGDCSGSLSTSFAAVSTAVEWIRNITAENPVKTNCPSSP